MKLLRNIYSETFIGRKVHMISTCHIAPLNLTGTVQTVSFNGNEPIFHIKDNQKNKVYKIGGFSKDLQYEFIK